ncbi:MAG: M28 family peptidase [Bryobacteraceae bacterium]
MRVLVLFLATISAFGADAQTQAAMAHISADSLRGNLSFLSSDLLEGRATPSPGLDIAAEFIAAQFRRAGLEPAGDNGYFQTATLAERVQDSKNFEMSASAGSNTIRIDPQQTSILADKPVDLDDVPVIVAGSAHLTPEQVAGKIVIATNFRARAGIPQGAALVLFNTASLRPAVWDPEASGRGFAINTISSPELLTFFDKFPGARMTLHAGPAIERRVKVHNVAAILRGSDPALRNTYVMLTAHYDHLGMRASGDDRIYNGANDDGSGTVSVIEIASALAASNPRPARSVLFVAFFGEEIGLTGSRYYARHPLVPLENTIADLNLEQVGRTDASNGPQIDDASVTGFDFSGLPRILREAGRDAGIKIYKDPQASDPYFARSDNQALADAGIPAHTLCVAFDYPDYHGVADEWQKIDYANMAKVDRAVALGILRLASAEPPPKWNVGDPAAAKYVEAARRLHGD